MNNRHRHFAPGLTENEHYILYHSRSRTRSLKTQRAAIGSFVAQQLRREPLRVRVSLLRDERLLILVRDVISRTGLELNDWRYKWRIYSKQEPEPQKELFEQQ